MSFAWLYSATIGTLLCRPVAWRNAQMITRFPYHWGPRAIRVSVFWGLATVLWSGQVVADPYADSLRTIQPGGVAHPEWAFGPPDGQSAQIESGHYQTVYVYFTDNVLVDGPGYDIHVDAAMNPGWRFVGFISHDPQFGSYCWSQYGYNGDLDLSACYFPEGYFPIIGLCWAGAHDGFVGPMLLDAVTCLHSEEVTYDIVSATFDTSVYQNGVETAQLTVVTKSNWGSSSNLSLQATLESNFGDIFDVGTDSFSLLPGEEHISQYSWPVPALDHPFDCDLSLALSDNGQPAGQLNRPGALGGMLATQEQLVQEQNRLQESNCLPPDQACALNIAGALPYVGIYPDFVGYVDNMCKVGEAVRAGDYMTAGVEALGALVSVVDLTCDVLEWFQIPVPNPFDWLPDAAGLAMGCAGDVTMGPGGGAGLRLRGGGEVVDSVAAHVRVGFEEIERAYSNEVFLGGSARLRVGVDGRWTSADTVFTTRTFCLIEKADTLTWIHVGPQPRTFGGAENPHSAVDIELRGTSVDTLDLGLLHRNGAGAVLWLRYEPFAVTGQSVARLSVADTAATYPLSVDYDGNGGVDVVLYPEGTSDVPEAQNPSHVTPSINRVEVRPNPFADSAVLSFEVAGVLRGARVDIYDVAGREVRRLTVGDLSPGAHQVVWDGRADDGGRLASGTYQCVTTFVGGRGPTKRVVVLQ